MSSEIIFHAVYKGMKRRFEISNAAGSGGLWYLYIDKLYYGAFFMYQGDWAFRPQHDYYFTNDQIKTLEDQLRKYHRTSK